MTIEEFSNEFDILLNSYSNSSAIGEQSSKIDVNLDEYEKSVFLTLAQEEIVRGLYKGNLIGSSFEQTEESRRYLDSLVRTIKLKPFNDDALPLLGNNSILFKLPEDTLFIIYEQAKSLDKVIKVIPMRHDEWHKSKNNPFRMPNENKIIRLDRGENIIELISHYPQITEYLIRYVSKPSPIILIKLPDTLSINGETDITECTLNNALHRLILERAVQLAYKRFPQASK